MTIPLSMGLAADVSVDANAGALLTNNYAPPFAFTGTIEKGCLRREPERGYNVVHGWRSPTDRNRGPVDDPQLSSITDRTLPAGSVNHAMSGPPPRNMPFSSISASIPG